MIDLAQRIYEQFSTAPLQPGQQDQLYIPLDPARGYAKTSIVQRLAEKIRRANGTPTCQVLAGHKGSGKSTELLRLQTELQYSDPRYFVVFAKTDDDLDRNDVDFPDLLIAIIRQLAAQLKQREGISLKPGYFKSRWEELKKLALSDVSIEGLELDVGMGTIAATIKSSPTARQEIRKTLDINTSNWIAAANDVIGQALLELKKKGVAGLVILADDLDKMIVRPHPDAGCSTAENLFVRRAPQLKAFNCHLLYTIPLSLAYSYQGQTIRSDYAGQLPVVPMTKIATKPPELKPYEPGVALFRDIIAARLNAAGATPQDLFRDDLARDELIRLSGGQPTELMTLVREAIISHELPIDPAALHRAKSEGQREYARQLLTEHWPILEEVRATGSFVSRTRENEAPFRELLDSRAILQYDNGDEWYALNPMVAALKPPASAKPK